MSYKKSIARKLLLLTPLSVTRDSDYLRDINEFDPQYKIQDEILVTFSQITEIIKEGNIEELHNLLLTPHEKIELIEHSEEQLSLPQRKGPRKRKDEKTNTSVLHISAKEGGKEILTSLLSFNSIKKLINVTDKKGTTPLMTAVWYENIASAYILLENGAEVNQKSHYSKKNVLHYASMMETDEICIEILKYNNEKSFINSEDSKGCTPLMLAVIMDSKCVNYLLSKGADIMKSNKLGRNILHMSVAYHRYTIMRKLVSEVDDLYFLDKLDMNNDSPLTLAVRTKDMFSFDCILESRFAHKLIQRCRDNLHKLIGKTYSIEKIIKLVQDPSFFNAIDHKGRPFLIYAAEKKDSELIHLLLQNNVDLKQINRLTGETVLHVAAASKDRTLLSVLLGYKEIIEIIDTQDFMGRTAYDIILEKADHHTWVAFYNSGFVGPDYFNRDHESSLYSAIRKANYDLMLCLLLSSNFFEAYKIPNIVNKNDLILSELKCEIYSSDIYIVFGIEGVTGCLAPSQDYLFEFNNKGQNIFHACTLGNNLEIATFIYDYVTKFTKHIEDFDKPDLSGNTPLMFTLKYSSPEMTKFFLSKKADFGLKNASGFTSLDLIMNNIMEYYKILTELLNECALIDSKVKVQGLSVGQLTLVYDVLCPKKYNQMYFFDNIFNNLGKKNSEILLHPVIEYFVLYKWLRIQSSVGNRFLLTVMAATFFSVYLAYYFTEFLNTASSHFSLLWWLTLFISVYSIIINLPLLVIFYLRKRFHLAMVIMSPILIFLFLQMHLQDRLALEVGAIAVLFSWFTVYFQGVHSRLSYQIAMFSQVFKKVISFIPLCSLILLAFSSCFFTLFNEYTEFNNPLHSFLMSSVPLLHGSVEIPIFQNDIISPNSSFKMFDVIVNGNLDGVKDTRNMLVEGSIALLFEILVTISVLNMLIGLSVDSSEDIELEGKIYNIHNYIEEISGWELFVETAFYRFFYRLHLEWLIGLPYRLNEILKAPTTLYPLQETEMHYDLFKLKRIAVEVDYIKNKPIRYFIEGINKTVKSCTFVESQRRDAVIVD